MFLSYMVFFHVHENNLPGFAQIASSQVHTFKKYLILVAAVRS